MELTNNEEQYYIKEELKEELTPIIDFIEYSVGGNTLLSIGLKSNITFKEFNQFFPDITKKQLVNLFSYCEEFKDECLRAINEIGGL